MFSLEKMHCFLKVFIKIFIKIRYKYEDKKDTTYLLKKWKSSNATWQLWTADLAPPQKLFYSELEENKYHSSTSLLEIFSSSS